MIEIQVGSTITNGSSAIRVTERVEKDPIWQASGWRGLDIPLEAFGGNPGTTSFVPDYIARSWRHVPFEWTPVVGGQVEERYVWAPGWRHLQREIRRSQGRPLVIMDEAQHFLREVGITQAGSCEVDNATGWCAVHNRVEG